LPGARSSDFKGAVVIGRGDTINRQTSFLMEVRTHLASATVGE
jgi:hypothetical protein